MIERGDIKRRPVGVLTDRDIVVQLVARSVDPQAIAAGDIMSRQPIVATETDDLAEAEQGMRILGIRRLPVLASGVTGVLASDEVLEVITVSPAMYAARCATSARQELRLRTTELGRAFVEPGNPFADRAFEVRTDTRSVDRCEQATASVRVLSS